ncbi:MAG: class II aldolase/adducin family protein [Rhodospirillaceae bacterium]|nr:class II aldolase/adducin family protein [Rhodospirillaceae bacterium]
MNAEIEELLDELVLANHILANENVVDSFGHISVRNPNNPNHYFLSCSRSPEIVSRDDIMEFDLEGNCVDGSTQRPYGERFIHGAIMESRPDVNSVVHNHSLSVIPFGVTGTPLQPIIHTGAAIGRDIPIWDIYDNFGDTDLLVRNMDHGRDLAKCLDQSTVILMRGHGCSVVGKHTKGATIAAVYLQISASIQLQSMTLGKVRYLTDGEIDNCTELFYSDLSMDRVWENLGSRVSR